MTIRVLELFCGTKSIGKYCAKHNYMFEVVSVDIDRKCHPTHVSDILEWDYTMYPPGYFQIVWASPPCTHYSVLRTTGGPRDIDGANNIVQRTLEIIKYHNPSTWFMENPATGYLKNQTFMSDIPFIDVHYCRYGFPYRKWTRIWTNLKGFTPKLCNMDCAAMIQDPSTGCIRHKGTFGGIYPGTPLKQRYSVPPALVEELIEAACKNMLKIPQILLDATYIKTMPIGGARIPIRIRAVRIDDPSETEEYNSISEAAKAIQDQCTQNNVRAVLTRCLSKNLPLAGRSWSIINSSDNAQHNAPTASTSSVPSETQTHPHHTAKPKQIPQHSKVVQSPPQQTSSSQIIQIDNNSVKLAELELQKQQVALKAKQVDLLLMYVSKLNVTNDPSLHVLIKQYLI